MHHYCKNKIYNFYIVSIFNKIRNGFSSDFMVSILTLKNIFATVPDKSAAHELERMWPIRATCRTQYHAFKNFVCHSRSRVAHWCVSQTCGSLTCFIAIQIVSQTDLIGPGSGLLLSIVWIRFWTSHANFNSGWFFTWCTKKLPAEAFSGFTNYSTRYRVHTVDQGQSDFRVTTLPIVEHASSIQFVGIESK